MDNSIFTDDSAAAGNVFGSPTLPLEEEQAEVEENLEESLSLVLRLTATGSLSGKSQNDNRSVFFWPSSERTTKSLEMFNPLFYFQTLRKNPN
jgi:hypothetical protein